MVSNQEIIMIKLPNHLLIVTNEKFYELVLLNVKKQVYQILMPFQ
jgi:hypothetical protein